MRNNSIKFILRSFLLSLLLFLSTNCAQNNGHIGPIFGKWQLQELRTPSGVEQHPAVFYNFQNNIVEALFITPQNDYYQWFGTFVLTDDSLHLSMEDNKPEEIDFLIPHPRFSFRVEELDRKRLLLMHGDSCWILKSF